MLGLQGAGKTTLVNVIAVRRRPSMRRPRCPRTPAHTPGLRACRSALIRSARVPALPLQVGEFTEDTIPTVGFNMRKVNKVRPASFSAAPRCRSAELCPRDFRGM